MAKNIENIYQNFNNITGPVLSIYLNTSPNHSDWRIRLKNGLRRTKEYIEAANPEQLKQFVEVSTKVEQKIKDQQTSLTNSFICFASTEKIHLYQLQIPVQNDFQWHDKIASTQLHHLLTRYPKSGVILLQHNKVTIITSLLGELIHEAHFTFDLTTNHWIQYKRSASGHTYMSGVNARDKFARRFKENQARWLKGLVATIKSYSRHHGWQHVYLAGPVELTKMMKQHLSLPITGETTRNYSGRPPHIILNKTILATT